MENTKLSPDQLMKVELEMNALVGQAHKQLDEWKVSLKRWTEQITGLGGAMLPLSLSPTVRLKDLIDQIKLEIVTTNEMGLDGREINIIYNMPDALVLFLTTPPEHLVLPAGLRDALKGSHIIEAKPQGVRTA